MAKKKKIKLVWSGGGVKLGAFIGALQRLEQEYQDQGYQLEIEASAGASAGFLLTAFIASGYTTSKELENLLMQIMPELNKFIKPSLTSLVLNMGFFRTYRLKKLFKRFTVNKMKDCKIPIKGITCNVDTTNPDKIAKIWYSKDNPELDLSTLMLASMAIPFVFPQVKILNEYHVDGGWVKNFPVDVFEGDNIIGVYFRDKPSTKEKPPFWRFISRFLYRILKLIQISISHNMVEDIQDNPNAFIIPISTDIDGLDFEITGDKIQKMILDGYNSTDKFLIKNGDKLP